MEADPEEHAREEWVDGIGSTLLLDAQKPLAFLIFRLLLCKDAEGASPEISKSKLPCWCRCGFLSLGISHDIVHFVLLLGQPVQLELRCDLDDLHPPCEPEHFTALTAVLIAHQPIEQLVELDEAILCLDAHPQDLLLHDVLACASAATERWPELLEEVEQVLLSDHTAAIPGFAQLCVPLPCLPVHLQGGPELDERTVLPEVESLELLDDDQDEEVQHDMGHKHDECDEVSGSERGSTVYALHTAVWCEVAVIHDLVPSFTSRDGEEQKESVAEPSEVLELCVDDTAFGDAREEEDPKRREHEEDQHQEQEHVQDGLD